MSQHNPFKPPGASVADIHVDRTFSQVPAIALAAAGLLSLALFFWWAPGYLRLVEGNAVNPVPMLVLVMGLVALVVGLWQAFPHGLRGRRSFLVSTALLAFGLVRLDGLSVYSQAFAPFTLAIAVALAGAILVHRRMRAKRGT